MTKLEKVARAIHEAGRRYFVQGTSSNDDYLPPWEAPWFLIDTFTAEPEVNWPGELIAEYDDHEEAHNHRLMLIARAAIQALMEPSEGMVAVGDVARDEEKPVDYIYRAMLTTALED